MKIWFCGGKLEYDLEVDPKYINNCDDGVMMMMIMSKREDRQKKKKTKGSLPH